MSTMNWGRKKHTCIKVCRKWFNGAGVEESRKKPVLFRTIRLTQHSLQLTGLKFKSLNYRSPPTKTANQEFCMKKRNDCVHFSVWNFSIVLIIMPFSSLWCVIFIFISYYYLWLWYMFSFPRYLTLLCTILEIFWWMTDLAFWCKKNMKNKIHAYWFRIPCHVSEQ